MAEDARVSGARADVTYKILDEQREALLPAEETLERARQTTIMYRLSKSILTTRMVRWGDTSDIIGIVLIVLLIPVTASPAGLAR